MKAKMNSLQRELDLLKLKLYNHEEETSALRATFTSLEDTLEEMKFEMLEMELSQCK